MKRFEYVFVPLSVLLSLTCVTIPDHYRDPSYIPPFTPDTLDESYTFYKTVDYDLWVLKIDASGDSQWSGIYGGQRYDGGIAVHQTPDKGFLVLGQTASFETFATSLSNLWLIKLDSLGIKKKIRIYGSQKDDFCRSMQPTSDGGYIIVGQTGFFTGADPYQIERKDMTPIWEWESDLWLLKVDEEGDTFWTRTYGDDVYDSGEWGGETSDKGFIVTGRTRSFGYGLEDLWLLKIDLHGDTVWTKTYGLSWHDRGYCVCQTHDGGYIVVGGRWFPGNMERASDIWILKTDAQGDTIWTKTLGQRSEYGHEEAFRVVVIPEEGYLVACRKQIDRIWLLKIGQTGKVIWRRRYQDTPVKDIKPTNDGGFIMVGEKENDLWIKKIDSRGRKQWERKYGSQYCDRGRWIQPTADGGYVIVGDIGSGN